MTWKTLPIMRGLRAALGILIAGLVLVTPIRGQSDNKDDLLDRQRRLLEVQSQKMEADVRTALTEAQRLTASDPTLALEKLRTALAKVEDDTALTQKRKDTLIRVLKDRIRVTELGDRLGDRGHRGEEKTDKPDLIHRKQEDLKETEKDDLQRSLDHIRALRKDGKMEEANQAAKQLVGKYPSNTAAQAAARTAAAAEFLANLRSTRSDSQQRTASISRDIDRSATPPSRDVEFPKDFQERTKNRTAVSMTKKEKDILKALNTPVSVAFKDSRFQDVIDYLHTVTKQPIMLDQIALDEAKITYETPITGKVKYVTVRHVQRKL